MGVMNILNSQGDQEQKWDPGNTDEIIAAELIFNDLKAKGYSGFSTQDDTPASRLDRFDPEAENIIMVPVLKGG